ncbi:MAG: hypothetical protein QW562_02070 [Thermosphaera sp.]
MSTAISALFSIGYILLGFLSLINIYKELARLSTSSRVGNKGQSFKNQSLCIRFFPAIIDESVVEKILKNDS